MVMPLRERPTTDHLKTISLFRGFSDSELSQILACGELLSVEPHANIVIEGELSGGLFVVLQGVVGIYKTNKLSGDTYDVGQLHEPSFFGEMSLVDDNPRSATVKALSECLLFHLPKDAFNAFLGASSAARERFHENCIRDLVSRLRELDDNYVISQYQLWKTAIRKESA